MILYHDICQSKTAFETKTTSQEPASDLKGLDHFIRKTGKKCFQDFNIISYNVEAVYLLRYGLLQCN